ncbi:carbohydrate porin [Methylobacterium sp. ID0610]|uniref:carbohydrate porin n=1 Tax=Methylobacterium carpenticola TaxID=3344827 RepID=UPI0036C942DB
MSAIYIPRRGRSARSPRWLLAAGLLIVSAAGVRAQPDERSPLDDRPPQSAVVEPDSDTGKPPSIQSSLGPLGDPGGFRTRLEKSGITYRMIYTNEVLGNISGGFRTGAIYAGKLESLLAVDFEKLAGLSGLSLFANSFQIHDTGGLRDRSFGRLITVSNIEAYPTTRLSELWLEQKWDGDRFGLRIGQITADGEFFAADYGKIFLSNDWPTITGANLPSGGPAYPLATPGLRLRFDPDASTSALVAVFNGNPGDQRFVNRNGTNFRLNDSPLVMAELQYRFNQQKDAPGPAGSVKLGGYHHAGRFEDLRYDTAGLPLADPFGTGIGRRLSGTGGLYGVAEFQLYRPPGGGPEDGITAYTRISASPSDRSLIDRWADGGIVVSGLVPGRPDDKFGISVIYARIGAGARGFDRDLRRLTGTVQPIRSFEASLEVTYQAQVAPGWLVQPDFQYVFKPAGGSVSPLDPAARVKGGALFGLRSTLVY